MTQIGTFKHGQIAWAMWQFFSQHNDLDPRRKTVPQSFVTRIRKMGTLGIPIPLEDKPGQAGIDTRYTPEQVFELTVALLLQDTGIKQSEAAFFIKHTRDRIQACYRLIMASPPAGRNTISTGDRPSSPTRVDDIGVADTSVFMSFRYVEIQEAWNRSDKVEKVANKLPPMFIGLKFHDGIRELSDWMNFLAESRDPIRIVVELSKAAVEVTNNLLRAPVSRRGRQS